MFKQTLLSTAYWAFKKFVEVYIASGLFERIEELFDELMSDEYAELSGEAKRQRVVLAVSAEFGEIRSAAAAVTRGVIELLWLRKVVSSG
jgi:hypothetical protein